MQNLFASMLNGLQASELLKNAGLGVFTSLFFNKNHGFYQSTYQKSNLSKSSAVFSILGYGLPLANLFPITLSIL